MRNPTTPCWAGAMPVAIEVSAAAVVDGMTLVIGPPAISLSSGSAARCASSCAHPRPSSTSSTTEVASLTGSGSHDGFRPCKRVGTT